MSTGPRSVLLFCCGTSPTTRPVVPIKGGISPATQHVSLFLYWNNCSQQAGEELADVQVVGGLTVTCTTSSTCILLPVRWVLLLSS